MSTRLQERRDVDLGRYKSPPPLKTRRPDWKGLEKKSIHTQYYL